MKSQNLAWLQPFVERFTGRSVTIQLVLPILLILIVFTTSYIVYQRHFSPLSGIPGPFWASVTPLWRLKKVLAGNWHEDIVRLHNSYGDLIRIAPNEVALNTPSAVQTIYGHTGKPWKKSEWYQAWWQPQMAHPFFSETDPLVHRDLRKRVSKGYSMSYILNMEHFIDPLVEKLRAKLTRLGQGSPLDMSQWTQYFAFDAVGELAFGKSFGFLDHESDHNGLLDAVYVYMTSAAAFGFLPKQAEAGKYKAAHWLLNRSFLKRINKHIYCDPRQPFEKIVKEKLTLSDEPDRNDLLTHFRTTKNADGSPMSPMDIFGESMNVVGAGADTTAISVRAILRYVCSNPRVYQKLQNEIDTAAATGNLSELPKFAEGTKLPYFQAVIKEALRVFPAVGYQLPRLVPEGGTQIDGVFLPANTTVGVNAWALHRNKSIFGENADEFQPERWVEGGDTKTMESCYASFGFGSRTCIGKNIALMEINKVVPMLFRDFDIEICNAEYPWEIITSWFSYQAHFYCRLTPRKSNVVVQEQKQEVA